jgi:NADH-ubiquinone oxidoreductase chain 2
MVILSILLLTAALPFSSVFYFSSIVINRVAILVLLLSSLLAFNALLLEPLGVGVGIYGGVCLVSVISQAFDCFILASGTLLLVLATGILPMKSLYYWSSTREEITHDPLSKLIPLILLLSTLGMSCLVTSSDLVTVYLSVELQSLPLYILACLYRDSEPATSAALKYFLIGALSSCLFLLGSSLLYALSGLTSLEGVYLVSSLGVGYSGFLIPVLFIGLAVLIKLPAAPFHYWAPDVYDGVPTLVTSWLAIMPKVALLAFLALYQGLSQIGGIVVTGYSVWGFILLGSALLSLVLGALLGVAQYRIKRMVAYSTISHLGFLLLALGLVTPQGLEAYLFYLFQYVVTSSNLFFVLLVYSNQVLETWGDSTVFLEQPKPEKDSSEESYWLEGLSVMRTPTTKPLLISSEYNRISCFHSNPVLALSFAICLFSMAGIPPLIGFFGKLLVLTTALDSGYYFLVFIAILVSVISTGFYLRVIRVLFFDSINFQISRSTEILLRRAVLSESDPKPLHSMVIATLSLIIILFLAYPYPSLNSLHLIALSFYFW